MDDLLPKRSPYLPLYGNHCSFVPRAMIEIGKLIFYTDLGVPKLRGLQERDRFGTLIACNFANEPSDLGFSWR